jgi:hypothetical protein
MIITRFNDLNEKIGEGSAFLKTAIEFMKTATEPKTAKEIWESIKDKIETKGITPEATLSTRLFYYSNNSNFSKKSETPYFRMVSNNPAKFWLIERLPELETSKKELEPEKILEPGKVLKQAEFHKSEPKKNPFGGEDNSSALCVLGGSGVGKSVRVEKTLEKEGHEFESIIPSLTTTNLLVQYKAGQGYVLGKLGKIILDAFKNPDKLYTVVFDEFHKSNRMQMINDELLQCISKKRNYGLRFVSLDPDTDELFKELPLNRGRRVIPDNLGFIFISSKEEIPQNNPDFISRVDVIHLTEEDKNNTDFLISVLKDKIEKTDGNVSY